MIKLYVKNRAEGRTWLSENHNKGTEVWLVYYKKGTAKLSIEYGDSVEEALCFGWIEVAKRQETQKRRIAESIVFLEQGKKLGLK